MSEEYEELKRSPETVEIDRSRRRIMWRVVVAVSVVGLAVFIFTRKAEEFFFSATGDVRSAFVWGFWTPIVALLLITGIYLVLVYTRLPKLTRIKRKQRRLNKAKAKLRNKEPAEL